MKHRVLWVVSCALFAGGLVTRHRVTPPEDSNEAARNAPIVGNPAKLERLYEDWKRDHASGDGAGRVELALSWSKGRSSEFTGARGKVTLDLAAREARFVVDGFAPEESGLDAWFVAYRPGMGDEYDARDDERLVALGTFALEKGYGSYVAPLGDELDDSFELDLVVLSRAGLRPSEAGLLYGTPDLFQRLYSAETRAAQRSERLAVRGLALGFAPPMPMPGGSTDPAPTLGDLIEEGERLFCKETFDGNGRTCCTCHPFDNNLTIEPKFISTLPDSDPLFLAETDPTLDHTQNGGLFFENPVLMRQFGLIVENLDGFGDLTKRFTMRGVPHTLALQTSIRTPPGGITPPKDRTGWSGDGAPNDGALRDFATGAVRQHFTRTLARDPHYDFRFPTPDELTAMEAFQLSTGRSEDFDLGTITFVDPEVEAGKGVFNGQGKCFECHFDAGANSRFLFPPGVFNENFDTGVEEFTQNHPDGTYEPRPIDGGFGLAPDGTFQTLIANDDGSFGDGTFNTAPLVEVADTLPAFHSNITLLGGLEDTVEGAISFYNSDEFNSSPGGTKVGGIRLDDLEIARVGKLLRVLNALENDRSAATFAQRARDILTSPSTSLTFTRANQLLTLGAAECEDGHNVLVGANLHPDVQHAFKKANDLLLSATSGPVSQRVAAIDEALTILAEIRPKLATE